MCPDCSSPEPGPITFHLSITKVARQVSEPLLRLSIRSRPSDPHHRQAMVTNSPRAATCNESVDEDSPGEDGSSSTVILHFTDGSPYWPPTEDTAPIREARSDSYERALTYYSAAHSPSLDSTANPPFVDHRSEGSSMFNSDPQASEGFASPPTGPPSKTPTSREHTLQRPLSDDSAEYPSQPRPKG